MEFIKKTESLCPTCKKVLPSEVVAINGVIELRRTCLDHGEFNVVIEKDIEFYKNVMNPFPPQLEKRYQLLLITHRCNIKCKDCYVPFKKHPDMNLEEFARHIEKAKQSGNIKLIILSGGEPTIHPQIFEFIKIARENKLRIIVNSNGATCADINFVKKLKDAGLDHLLINIRDMDDKIQLLAMENINKVGGMLLYLNFVVYKNSNESIIKKVIKYSLDNKIKNIRIRSCLPNSSRVGGHPNTDQYCMSELLELTAVSLDLDKNYFKNQVHNFQVATYSRVDGRFYFEKKNNEYKIIQWRSGIDKKPTCRFLNILWFNWLDVYKLDYILHDYTHILHQTRNGDFVPFPLAILEDL